ncbi:ASCH domain-containing protein [Nocardia sp. GCM10030253]|uniref:ASCH domain-containing protein n=1 Tax=Nocardia sp. GCM10030253 TaxID=3273404 RepID=UPI003635D837
MTAELAGIETMTAPSDECRALSVRRPWANLIVAGHKSIENRSWTSSHRGRMLIHAGRAWVPAGAALAAVQGIDGFGDPGLCAGGYVGVVRLVDVHPAAGCCGPWGFQDDGTYHWVLTNPQALPTPIPGSGRLGLYRAPAHVLAEVR